MASSVVVIVLLHFLFEQCLLTRGSMHWVVTEDGRIQSQADSVYNLRRPYDLVAFMHQEDRATVLNHLKKELLNRKGEIDKSEDRDTTGLEQKFYKSDYDCLQAGTPLPEIDLYISTILPIEHRHISDELSIEIQKAAQPSDNKIGGIPPEPDCTKVLQLDFTPHGFEHLEGVQDRMNLTGSAELGLTHAIPFIPDKTQIPDFGHVIAKELKKNSTSWVLYNMAAFYWRVKGDPWMTVECLRRALHFSPRENKDIALISLGNILHRARYSNEAAIVVHSALELSKELNVNHFTLGNIYAVLGEYNKSIICYENTLRIQPDFEAATIRKHAVLCHQKLEAALEAQHRSLQKTLRDLKDYQKKHDLWHIQNDRMLLEQVSQEDKVSQNIAFELNKAKQTSTKDIGEYCNMVEREGKQVLLCTWNRQAPTLEMMDQFALEEQKKESEKNRQKLNRYEKKAIDYNLPVRAPLYVKHDRQAVPRFNELELDNTWPEKEECDSHLLTSPDPFNLSTVYLSPENKGFEVKALLTEAQNLKDGAEHPLPWYPPICVTLLTINEYDEKTYDNLKSVGHPGRTKVPLKMNDPSMRKTLLSHVNGGSVTEEEVGQRILSAIKQEVGARWVLFNLAGLYWRIVGNNYHGIECIRRSLALAPDEYADVPLVNMANILYKWGRYDDAIVLMKDALKINDAEPDSNFLMANLLWVTKNYSGAISHYRTVLDIIPEHQEAFDSLRAIKCLQKFLIKEQSVAPIEVPSQPVGNSCQQKGVANKNQQTESRVICKTENGEEKCIIETRMRGKSGECNGHCTQTCTITPIKVESSCGGPDLAVDTSNPVQCHQKGSQCGEAGEELLFTNDFTNKLDEVSEHYEKKGICTGEDCNTLRVQTEQKKPHIKLEFIDGVLHQKLIFVQDANDIHVEDSECVIFNDGIKSPGCDQAQYRSYSEELAHTNINFEFRYVGDENSGENVKVSQCTMTPNNPRLPSDEIPYGDISDGVTKWPTSRRKPLNKETDLRCYELKQIDFSDFQSTYLSYEAKNIKINYHLDFTTTFKHNLIEPECSVELVIPQLARDHLVRLNTNTKYQPEIGLKEVLQSLNGEVEPVEVVGHRIALALQQNPKSWVAASAAGLYWRVEGDFTKALNCYRLALSYAPLEKADLMLLGYANILVQGDYYNNAIIVEDLALEIQSTLPIHYFTLGNIFAALGKWKTAVSFYEATRFYQEDFGPAVNRLRAIHCENLA